MEENKALEKRPTLQTFVEEGEWFSKELRRQALEEVHAALAAHELGLGKRAEKHKNNVVALRDEDRALREYTEFPKKFSSLVASHGLPVNPNPVPIQFYECSERYNECREIWFEDGFTVRIPFLGWEGRAPGWTHLQRVDLDSDYPAPSMPLYITVAALQEIVPRDQIMVFVEQEHERRRRVSNPDPILVVKAGDGYYLIARWK